MLAVQKAIQENLPYLKAHNLLLALSGGIDSMVLAHALLEQDISYSVAHVNYQLRDQESDEDERFVYEFCKLRSIRLFNHRENIDSSHTSNIQNLARDIRHSFFKKLIEEYKFDLLLTSHHQDDRVENFIMNLSRGAGLKGLVSMPQSNQHIFRPFINLSKDEIAEYANHFKIQWREDSSNSKDYYLRNFLRLNIIPQIEKQIPHFSTNTARSIRHLQKSFELKEYFRNLWLNDHVSIQNELVQIEIQNNNEDLFIYDVLSEYGFHPNTSDEIFKNLNQAGKTFESHDEWIASMDRHHLFISRKTDKNSTPNSFLIEKHQNLLALENSIIKISRKYHQLSDRSYLQNPNHIIMVDEEKLNFPLTLRKWQPGDSMKPLGMKGMAKKIQDILVDKKVPLIEKQDQWILCSDQEIIWLVNQCVSESVKINSKTKKILIIENLNINT